MGNQLIKKYKRGYDQRYTRHLIQPVHELDRNAIPQFISIKSFRSIQSELNDQDSEEHHTDLQGPVWNAVYV